MDQPNPYQAPGTAAAERVAHRTGRRRSLSLVTIIAIFIQQAVVIRVTTPHWLYDAGRMRDIAIMSAVGYWILAVVVARRRGDGLVVRYGYVPMTAVFAGFSYWITH